MNDLNLVFYSFSSNDFEWHRMKAESNEEKHGVRFEQAASIFEDDFAILLDDPIHSQDEARFIMLGETTAGLLLSSAHVERGGRIRLINARPVTKRERRMYDRERRARVRDAT